MVCAGALTPASSPEQPLMGKGCVITSFRSIFNPKEGTQWAYLFSSVFWG